MNDWWLKWLPLIMTMVGLALAATALVAKSLNLASISGTALGGGLIMLWIQIKDGVKP